MCSHVADRQRSRDTKLPDLPVPWGQVHLGAGVVAAVIVVLKLLIGSDESTARLGVDLDRKFGLFLAVIAAIVVAVGGVLKFQEGDARRPPPVGGTGSAPF